jgi:hypothetical protein
MENKEAVEQLYMGIGMVETMAGMVATASWSGDFSRVLGMGYWFLRAPFLVSSCILLLAFGGVCVLGRFDRELPRSMSGV